MASVEVKAEEEMEAVKVEAALGRSQGGMAVEMVGAKVAVEMVVAAELLVEDKQVLLIKVVAEEEHILSQETMVVVQVVQV